MSEGDANMMNIKEIELAIAQLSEDAVWELAKWFEEYQAELWDKEIEQDLAEGRLDFLIQEAEQDLKNARTMPL